MMRNMEKIAQLNIITSASNLSEKRKVIFNAIETTGYKKGKMNFNVKLKTFSIRFSRSLNFRTSAPLLLCS